MSVTGNLPAYRPTTDCISAITPDHAAIIEKPARVSCPIPGPVVHLHPATTCRIKEEHHILNPESFEMIVIGIDPGLARMGYGVIAVNNRQPEAVCYGCIESAKDLRTPERLLHIYTGLTTLLEKYPPAHIAVEKLFFTKNITSAMSVSEARGVILLLAEQRQIPVTEYTPNQVKQAITGSGRADKRQMQEMIMRLLHLPELPRPDDAADALSIALCHIHILR